MALADRAYLPYPKELVILSASKKAWPERSPRTTRHGFRSVSPYTSFTAHRPNQTPVIPTRVARLFLACGVCTPGHAAEGSLFDLDLKRTLPRAPKSVVALFLYDSCVILFSGHEQRHSNPS